MNSHPLHSVLTLRANQGDWKTALSKSYENPLLIHPHFKYADLFTKPRGRCETARSLGAPELRIQGIHGFELVCLFSHPVRCKRTLLQGSPWQEPSPAERVVHFDEGRAPGFLYNTTSDWIHSSLTYKQPPPLSTPISPRYLKMRWSWWHSLADGTLACWFFGWTLVKTTHKYNFNGRGTYRLAIGHYMPNIKKGWPRGSFQLPPLESHSHYMVNLWMDLEKGPSFLS